MLIGATFVPARPFSDVPRFSMDVGD